MFWVELHNNFSAFCKKTWEFIKRFLNQSIDHKEGKVFESEMSFCQRKYLLPYALWTKSTRIDQDLWGVCKIYRRRPLKFLKKCVFVLLWLIWNFSIQYSVKPRYDHATQPFGKDNDSRRCFQISGSPVLAGTNFFIISSIFVK